MSARSVAKTVVFSRKLNWETLERAAFVDHPTVLARGDARVRPPRRFYWNFVWAAPVAIVYFALFLAPVWGLAAVYSGIIARAAPDPVPEEAIPVSGTMFAIAAGFMLISFGHWLVTGLRKNGFYQIQASLVLVLGGVTGLRVTVLGRSAEVPDWQLWVVPIGIAMGMAALFLLLHLVVQLRRNSGVRQAAESGDGDGSKQPPISVAELSQRKRWATALSDDQQAQVQTDLDAAIDDLESRGVITSAVASVARHAEFGDLAAHMSRTSNTQ